MTFAVDHLPEGLTVDTADRPDPRPIEKPGEYVVTLRAANALGEAKRKFKIVCGDTLALTPHMGWNSWYVWETHVTDKIMRDAADAMVSSGMINHGYKYVNIDDCWAVKPGATDPRSAASRAMRRARSMPNKRFPDMKALTDYIHGKGLKAGIYTSPGPTTCGGYVGAYQHEATGRPAIRRVGIRFPEVRLVLVRPGGRRTRPRALCKKPYRLMGGILQANRTATWCSTCANTAWATCGSGAGRWATVGARRATWVARSKGIPAALFRDGFGLFGTQRVAEVQPARRLE